MPTGAIRLVARNAILALGVCALAGCGVWKWRAPPRPALPKGNAVALDQLVIISNFELPSRHRLLQEINAQRVDLSNQLNLPVSDETIRVYLFKDDEEYYSFIRHKFPSFPERRAFFVETDTQLTVYAHWGDRVAEDLRHEVAHGYLHSVVQNLPLWLDEGLAEYFEVPRGNRGLNPPHVVELARLLEDGSWQPNLRRLEEIRSPAELSQIDYAESWAWVHWMLESEPARKTLLQQYLAELRKTGIATPLSLYLRREEGDPHRSLVEYLQNLAATL